MNLIDGQAIAAGIRKDIAGQVAKMAEKPGLTVILVGDNQASQVYVRNKEKFAAEVGFKSNIIRLSAAVSEAELLKMIEELNNDKTVNGILVQLPLPDHIDEERVTFAIDPAKDVDGFHPYNSGLLFNGSNKGLIPCTPAGCIELIKSTGVNIEGKKAVVIGRSNIVGKPVAQLLLREHATVVMTHSRTADLPKESAAADILVVAIGKAKFVTADMVKPGAIVIDVGMNRDENGKLCGDVDFETVKEVAGHLTPVPRGVGPMTIAMLLKNTLEAKLKSSQ